VKFLFSDHILDIDRRELARDGGPVAVEPQVFDLLVYLVQNRDRVVSKDDLIAAIWAGRIVSESTLTSRINAARKAVGDSGKEQRLIRTVPRKGLRFVGDVDVEGEAGKRPRVDGNGSSHPPIIADRPSIAVLPLENLSEDRSLELIANGLAEDIIALLARVPGFFVISRASSFVYRIGTTEIRQIAEELGVRYVVTGSARSTEQRVRIAVQLIEAMTGNQLWASRYDVPRGDTLDLQDEIARQIMVELEPELTKAELQIIRRRRTESIDAWSEYRQAAGIISMHGWNEDTVSEGLERLHKALAIDPEFSLARALRALLCAFGANLSLVPDAVAAHKEAVEEAERAVALDPHAPDVLGFAGCAIADAGNFARGREILERALELDPSNAQAHVALGIVLTRMDEFDNGIAHLELGMRTSPRDFRLTFWNMLLADALGRAGRFSEALSVADGAARRDARLYGARVISAWSLQRLGRPGEARTVLADARRIRPSLSLAEIQRFFGKQTASDLTSVWA
jgi:TolB-like protein/DNA-binding response OmpR family regulator